MFSFGSASEEEFGFCPICGASWEWKPSGSILLGRMGEVLICIDCLKHPEKLDSDRIASSLEEYSGGRLHMRRWWMTVVNIFKLRQTHA